MDNDGIYNFYLPEKNGWRTLLLLSVLVENLEHDNTIVSATDRGIPYYDFVAGISLSEKEELLDSLVEQTRKSIDGVTTKAM